MEGFTSSKIRSCIASFKSKWGCGGLVISGKGFEILEIV